MQRILVVFTSIALIVMALRAVHAGHSEPAPIAVPADDGGEAESPQSPTAARFNFTFHSDTSFEDQLLGLSRQAQESSESPSLPSDGSDLDSANPKTAPIPRGLMPTSGSEPLLEPRFWNYPQARFGNNCYAYACDDLNPFRHGIHDFPQPGNAAGLESADPSTYTVALLKSRAIADGLIPVATADSEKAAPEGFYRVALFVAQGRDYHWYRQDADGFWSHKLGIGDVQVKDASGRRIVDPRLSDRAFEKLTDPQTGQSAGQNYSLFGGFFLVPQGGIRLGGFHHP